MKSFGLNSCNRSQIIFFFHQFSHLPSKFSCQILLLINYFRYSDRVLLRRRRCDRTRIITTTPHNYRRSHLNSSISPDLAAAGAGLRSRWNHRARRFRAEVRWNSKGIWKQMDHSWKGIRSPSLKTRSIVAFIVGIFNLKTIILILLFLFLSLKKIYIYFEVMHWESGDKVFGFVSGWDLSVVSSPRLNHARGNYNICFSS